MTSWLILAKTVGVLNEVVGDLSSFISTLHPPELVAKSLVSARKTLLVVSRDGSMWLEFPEQMMELMEGFMRVEDAFTRETGIQLPKN